jgi:MFS family permease
MEPAARTSAGDPRLLSPAFLVAALAAGLNLAAFFMYLNLAAILESLGATSFLIGAAVGMAQVVRVFLGPYVGRQADRTGHRTLLVAGSALQALACALYLAVHDAGPWLFAIRAVHGLAAALVFCSIDAYIVTTIPLHRRAQGLSLYTAIAFGAIAAGGAIGELVLRHLGSDSFFLTSAALSALAIPFAARIRRCPVAVEARSFLAVLSFRNLYPAWLLFCVFSFIVVQIHTFLSTFVSSIQAGSLGLFFVLSTIVSIAVKLVFGSLADRRGTRLPLVTGMIAVGLSLLVLGSANSAGHIAAAGMLSGVGWGLAFPQFFALVVQRAPAGEIGTALAVLTSCAFLGESLGSSAWGWLVDLSSHRVVFRTGGVLLVIVALLVVSLLRDASLPEPARTGPDTI